MDVKQKLSASWGVAARLSAGFAALILLTILMAVSGSWQMGAIVKQTRANTTEDAAAERIVRAWLQETKANSVRAIVLTRSEDAALKAILAPQMEATSKRITELQKQVEGVLRSDEAKALFAAVGEKRQAYLDVRKKAAALRAAGKADEAAQAVDTAMVPAVETYVASISALVDHYVKAMDAGVAASEAQGNAGRNVLVGLGLASVLLGLVLARWLTLSITRPLGTAVELAEQVAAGNLTGHVETARGDELGKLLNALGRMNESLRRIVGEVRHASDTIATGSTEIASGTQDLSARTEEQSSNLQQTAASMEQLTATVRQSGQSAAQANELATRASTAARTGGEVVGKVVDTMDRITAQSRKIADIIAVIDGIAFQTNILALNAAVEAARAGEQGRGFAVVASEVRILAQRSATAAREIKELISTSVSQIEDGGVLVKEAGKSMDEIVGQVRQVSELIGEITAASREEGSGIAQINDAVVQLDKVTQQNAALVEESAAAADSLRAEAQRLAQTVAVFRLAA